MSAAVAELERVVGALLFCEDRMLLCRRNPARASHPGVWDMPGGHIEAGERPWDALVRELKEELGIAALPARPSRRVCDKGVELTIWVLIAWSGAVVNRLPEEHAELRWLMRWEAMDLSFPHPGYPQLIADAFIWVESSPGVSPP